MQKKIVMGLQRNNKNQSDIYFNNIIENLRIQCRPRQQHTLQVKMLNNQFL